MSKHIKLKKGFDINLSGKAEKKVNDSIHPEMFAVKPSDFQGFNRVKLLVKEGDAVKAGSPIFYDKQLESVRVAAPVSGKIVEVKRGEKRRLLEIKIKADKTVAHESFKSIRCLRSRAFLKNKL